MGNIPICLEKKTYLLLKKPGSSEQIALMNFIYDDHVALPPPGQADWEAVSPTFVARKSGWKQEKMGM